MMKLPRNVFNHRRLQVLDALPSRGALLLPAGSESKRNSDVTWPFRPDSDFYYLAGFPEPDAWLLLRKDADGSGTTTLFVPPRDPEREVWTGPRHGTDGATLEYGADVAFDLPALSKELPPLLADVETLYFAFGRHPTEEHRLWELLAPLRRGRKAGLGPTSLIDPRVLLDPLRMIKHPLEIEVMREGARITDEAHRAAMAGARPGMYGYELQALLDYTFRRHGAWGWAYPTIVGAGRNACVLHYVRTDSELRDGELVLVDAGAEVDGLATDITRTFPANGRYTAAQRDVYQAVLDAQQTVVAASKPGETLLGLHEQTCRLLAQSMLDLGLLQGSLDEVMEQEAYKRYYMHRTSHWMGMDVHDVGRYILSDGEARPLEPGMVYTVEPGIYIAPDDEQAPEHLRGIGVRIEDDVLITEDGFENLTLATPRTIAEIEALRDR